MSNDETQIVSDIVYMLLNDSDNYDSNSIPKRFLPTIKAVLIEMKSTAIKKGQTPIVKKIQHILSYLPEDHKKSKTLNPGSSSPNPNLSPTLANNNTPSLQRQTLKSTYNKKNVLQKRFCSDEQLDTALDKMVNGSSFIPEAKILPELIKYSKKKIDDLIKEGELFNAQKYEDVYEQMQASKQTWENCSSKAARIEELRKQLEITERSLDEAEKNMESGLTRYDNRMKAIREAQEQKFAKFIDDYDRETASRINNSSNEENNQFLDFSPNKTGKFKDSNLPTAFKKSSQNLLDLREKEKYLIMSRRFEEANCIRQEADSLEAFELQQCKLNYLQSRTDQKTKLIEEHNQQMNCFGRNGHRVRLRIKNDNETRINSLKKAKENFLMRINELDSEIKGKLAESPPPTPLPARPLRSLKPPNELGPTFMTQQQQKLIQQNQPHRSRSVNSKQIRKKNQKNKSPQTVFRPISSMWRLNQSPTSMKT